MTDTTHQKLCIGTAFYHTSGKTPNLRTFSEKKKLLTYYRCMVVFFASARSVYPDTQLILFSNALPSKEYINRFEHYDVIIKIISDADVKQSKGNLTNTFPGCLFTLDVIAYFVKEKLHEKYTAIVLFDSDCIVRMKIDTMLNNNSGYTIKGIKLDYPVSRIVNGQSRATLSRISKDLYQSSDVIAYYGGEFYYFSSSILPELNLAIQSVCLHVEENRSLYGSVFTEEHLLSIALSAFKRKIAPAGYDIKRIWTSYMYTNVENKDDQYAVYHLPAEKDKLFVKLAHQLKHNPDLFSSGEYRQNVYKYICKRANPPPLAKAINEVKKGIKKFLAR